MLRRLHRHRDAGELSLSQGTWQSHIRRVVAGQLRAQQVTLHGDDCIGLFDLALSSRTDIRNIVCMALRRAEKHDRHHNEKPRQDRATSSYSV